MEQKNQNKVPALKGAVDTALGRIQELRKWGALHIPKDYSPENAIRSASFIIADLTTKEKKPVMEACTKASIQNALLDMVVQGLNPMKNQVAFIPRGNKLYCQRQYAGTEAMARRFGGVKEVIPVVIYENDKFKYRIDPQTGYYEITEHEQSLENIDINKVKGAYAVVHKQDGSKPFIEIMTKAQIQRAWNQGDMNGQSPAHKNFTEEMAKKTVSNRACKRFINRSDDAPIVHEEEEDLSLKAAKEEIQESANQEEIQWTQAEVEEEAENKKGEANETEKSEVDKQNNQSTEPESEEAPTEENTDEPNWAQ
ncbi:MAG: recombinase RecT [Bacteroidales bacterium]